MTLPDHVQNEIHPTDSGEAALWLPGRGYLHAYELREIADELDRRNDAAAGAEMKLVSTAVTDGMHRYVFERPTPEIPEDGCCTGRSPCPVKAPEPRPGAIVNANGVFCGTCCSRLNVKTPPVCPDCGEDLTCSD
jgi:hypothetical protein